MALSQVGGGETRGEGRERRHRGRGGRGGRGSEGRRSGRGGTEGGEAYSFTQAARSPGRDVTEPGRGMSYVWGHIVVQYTTPMFHTLPHVHTST